MKFLKSLLTPSKTKWFWCYFVGALLLVVAGVFLLPVWSGVDVFWASWSNKVVKMVIGVLLLVYIFTYLIHKTMRRGNGVIKILLILEMVLMALITLGCFLSQFEIIKVGGACQIVGLALWCRGVIEVFIAYFHQRDSKERYPLSRLVIAIVFITLGVYLFAKPLFQDVTVMWVVSVFLIILGLAFIYIGVKSKPASKKVKKEKKAKPAKESKPAKKESK